MFITLEVTDSQSTPSSSPQTLSLRNHRLQKESLCTQDPQLELARQETCELIAHTRQQARLHGGRIVEQHRNIFLISSPQNSWTLGLDQWRTGNPSKLSL